MARGPAPRKLTASRSVRRDLKLLVRRQRAPHVLVVRGRIILMALRGLRTTEIAHQLGITTRTVRKWKARFAEDPHIQALEDRERSGRPNVIGIHLRCRLVQLACERPEESERPVLFRDLWTYGSLANALAAETGRRISVSEVGRILRFEGLRPHRVRQWLKSSDPDFDVKAKRVCDLYLRPPKGAIVVCVDEKPLQVLGRKHATHVDERDGATRYEYEYVRNGTQALLAAFDVRTGGVFARVVPSRSAEALVSFMEELASKYPGKQVYVVWDNLNIHYDGKDGRWTSFNSRHKERFHFVYTPKHASWMNQIEIWFSILQRRVIRYGDFPNRQAQRRRILGFVGVWNRSEKHPFRWTWRANPAKNRQRQAA